MNNLCIGLFGTCGASTWRDDLIKVYEGSDIDYYNPMVPDWTPECAKEEAEHLANDAIILFPVLDETYAFGSLSEIGFSILQAIKLDDRRDIVILISERLNDELMKDKDKAQESLKARALVREHLKKLRIPNVYLVDNLTEMESVSLTLYENHLRVRSLRQYFNPHLREYKEM